MFTMIKTKRRARRVTVKSPATKLEAGTSVSVVIPYPAVSGNHAVRHARGRHYRTDAAQAYRASVVREIARLGLAKRFTGPLTAEYWLCPPDNRARDEDNVLKEVKDALTAAGFWVDDSNKVITRSIIEWLPAVRGGAVRVAITGR